MITLNKSLRFAALLTAFVFLQNCNNETIPPCPTDGNGELVLKLKAGDVKTEIITRSTLDIDINSFKINLSENDGTPLFVNKLYGELNETDCTLPAESGYQITAESCSQDESVTQNGGYGYPRFVGEATFNITPRQETHVNIKCTMVNAGLQISFDQTFLDKFPTHAITTQDTRALVFNSNNAHIVGYYDVNENTSLKLRLTGSAGGWEDRLDTIKEIILEKGKIKRLLITYTDNSTRVICI